MSDDVGGSRKEKKGFPASRRKTVLTPLRKAPRKKDSVPRIVANSVKGKEGDSHRPAGGGMTAIWGGKRRYQKKTEEG